MALAIQAGTRDSVGKWQNLEDLVTAIRTVAKGDTYLPPDVAAELDSSGAAQQVPQTASSEDLGAEPGGS